MSCIDSSECRFQSTPDRDRLAANLWRAEMRRREFIAVLGSATAWPAIAGAQQLAMPVVGWLDNRSAQLSADNLAAFRQGLARTGFVENRNVAIEYRFAELQNDRVPGLAADLVRHQVAVTAGLVTTQAVLVAKAATSVIPIVFVIGGDPVKNGLVASLNRPGGNVTGVSYLTNELGPKRRQLLRELLPNAGLIAALANPTNPNAAADISELLVASESMGIRLDVHHAVNERDIDAFFEALAQRRPSAFLTVSDSLFTGRRQQITTLAAVHGIPAIYHNRDFMDAGGLMSYAPDINDAFHPAGVYTGRILKGEKPADLPVLQPTQFELVINLRAAKSLGLAIPETLLATADEVIQ
jgi:putative tryptophan/tyrosine transport system substrate-binding protein